MENSLSSANRNQGPRFALWLGSLLTCLILGTATSTQAGEAADPAKIDTFRELCREQAAAAAKASTMTVIGTDGWLFLAKELRHISAGKYWGEEAAKVSQASKPEFADPFPAILDFKEQLDSVGVALLLVPVPPKVVVYPDKLPGSAGVSGTSPRLDSAHREFFELLRSQGVEVLDLVPVLEKLRRQEGKKSYCMQDTHWSGLGCAAAAREIARHLKPMFQDLDRIEYGRTPETVQIKGDLWRDLQGKKPAREIVDLLFVGEKEAPLEQPVSPDRESPVILLGDSHALVFHAGHDMHAQGAGLADQLAYELGFPVDLIGVRGSGATPARVNLLRRARPNPDYLAKKKIVVWCFSAREFTESQGWQKVPVVKKAE